MRDEVARSLLSVERTGHALRARILFAPDLTVFQGHFPGAPVVPGIFLVEAVRQAAERANRSALRIVSVDARFRAPIGPGVEVEVEAVVDDASGSTICRAKLTAGGGAAAEITIALAPDGVPEGR